MFILHGVRNPQKFSEGENCVREATGKVASREKWYRIDWPVGAVGECVKAECSKELMLDEKYGYIH